MGVAEEDRSAQATDTVSLSMGDVPPVIEPKKPPEPPPPKALASPEPQEEPTKPGRLSKKDLRERLTLASSGLVEELHALALRQNSAEDLRESRLDAKAQGLMATAGLSLTVAFTFGGLLLQYPKVIRPLGWFFGRVVILFYALALVLGLLAGIWALRALFVRSGYRAITDEDVFHKATLDSIDRAAFNDSDKAKSLYRRFITIQHWRVYRAHFDVHEEKADLIKCGQKFFLGFLIALLLIGGGLTYSAFVGFERRDDKSDAAATSAQSTPTGASSTSIAPIQTPAPSTASGTAGSGSGQPATATGSAATGTPTVPTRTSTGSAATGANP